MPLPEPNGDFLSESAVINWKHSSILELAAKLKSNGGEEVQTAKNCFNFVRDEIKHSSDHQLGPITITASDVLEHKTGFCFAKSHLLAALLRANGIPAGLCYQRIALDLAKNKYCLHGLNAVMLPSCGWHVIDARGNRADISTQFSPPVLSLAFEPTQNGECLLPRILSKPLPTVIDSLETKKNYRDLERNLPDCDPNI